MIRGTVVRQLSTPLGTPGALSLANGFSCNTLELPWHGNERGVSCIKPDEYEGWVWISPTFGRLVVRLQDKHGRRDCLLHHGNFAAEERDLDGDTVPEVANIRGCTLLGRGYGELLRRDGRPQWGIKSSGSTLAALIDSLKCAVSEASVLIDGQAYANVLLTYSWAEGCAPEQST